MPPVEEVMWLKDLALKRGALGLAVAACCLLTWGISVMYVDLGTTRQELLNIVREQISVQSRHTQALENNNKLIEFLLYERNGNRTSGEQHHEDASCIEYYLRDAVVQRGN